MSSAASAVAAWPAPAPEPEVLRSVNPRIPVQPELAFGAPPDLDGCEAVLRTLLRSRRRALPKGILRVGLVITSAKTRQRERITDARTGRCDLSMEAIVARAHYDRSRVFVAIDVLIALGCVERVKVFPDFGICDVLTGADVRPGGRLKETFRACLRARERLAAEGTPRTCIAHHGRTELRWTAIPGRELGPLLTDPKKVRAAFDSAKEARAARVAAMLERRAARLGVSSVAFRWRNATPTRVANGPKTRAASEAAPTEHDMRNATPTSASQSETESNPVPCMGGQASLGSDQTQAPPVSVSRAPEQAEAPPVRPIPGAPHGESTDVPESRVRHVASDTHHVAAHPDPSDEVDRELTRSRAPSAGVSPPPPQPEPTRVPRAAGAGIARSGPSSDASAEHDLASPDRDHSEPSASVTPTAISSAIDLRGGAAGAGAGVTAGAPAADLGAATRVLTCWRKAFAKHLVGAPPRPGELDPIFAALARGFTVAQMVEAIAAASWSKHNVDPTRRTLNHLLSPKALQSLSDVFHADKAAKAAKDEAAEGLRGPDSPGETGTDSNCGGGAVAVAPSSASSRSGPLPDHVADRLDGVVRAAIATKLPGLDAKLFALGIEHRYREGCALEDLEAMVAGVKYGEGEEIAKIRDFAKPFKVAVASKASVELLAHAGRRYRERRGPAPSVRPRVAPLTTQAAKAPSAAPVLTDAQQVAFAAAQRDFFDALESGDKDAEAAARLRMDRAQRGES